MRLDISVCLLFGLVDTLRRLAFPAAWFIVCAVVPWFFSSYVPSNMSNCSSLLLAIPTFWSQQLSKLVTLHFFKVRDRVHGCLRSSRRLHSLTILLLFQVIISISHFMEPYLFISFLSLSFLFRNLRIYHSCD